MESIEKINQTVQLNEKPQLKSEYFRSFKNYNIYYKAQTIENPALNLIMLRSYETDIAIYNPVTDVIYYDIDYYACSHTTREQLSHFLSTHVKGNNYYKNTVKELYLTTNEFNELSDIFFNSTNFKEYLNIEKTYLTRYYELHQKLYSIREAQKKDHSFYYFPWYAIEPHKTETKTLKTRTKTINYYQYGGLEVIEILTYSKTKNKKLLSVKLKIASEWCLIFDNRKAYDKNLYNGCDIGVNNNKNLTYRYF